MLFCVDMYKIYKVSHEYECYLNIIPMRLRCYFTRLRMSLHPLRIQTGRYNNNNNNNNNRIERSERYCVFCNNNDIEDEYHFICLCPLYNHIRKKYILIFFMLTHLYISYTHSCNHVIERNCYLFAYMLKKL